MSTKTEAFIRNITELSEADSYDNAVKEWVCVECFYTDRLENKCLCGQPIKYNMIWENKINGHKITVGSDCSEYHLNQNYDNAQYMLQKQKRQNENRTKNAKQIEQAESIMNMGTDWEKKFCTSIRDIYLNGWNISEKQKVWWDKIRNKYFKEEPIQAPTAHINFDPISFGDKRKEEIQRRAFAIWSANGYKGTTEIATGVGKTMLGIMAVQQNPNAKILIVVPKIDLQTQWINDLKKVFGDSITNQIGRVGDGYHEMDKRIVVAIVNSIRESYLIKDLLIMDEMHRYGSCENIKFLDRGQFKKILGLTATAKREDGAHLYLYTHAPLIFKFSQKEAIDNKILAGFHLINKKVDLEPEEREGLNSINEFIKENFPMFNNDFGVVRMSLGGDVRGSIACDLMRAFNKRKNLLLHNQGKINETLNLLEAESYPKTIVFCQFIKTADAIVKQLKAKGVKAAKYHSKMKGKEKTQMLEDFKTSEVQIMVSVRSLDEGTNIPDCEMAIIVAGSGVTRQMIQRLGRVLRIAEGKGTAKVYQLYIGNSQDYVWMKNRTKELSANAEKVEWI